MALPRRQELPWYRTEITRWGLITTGVFLAFSFSPVAPGSWRNTPSLRWLHEIVPWPVVCAAFVVYTVLLIHGSTVATAVADFLGLFIYLLELIALFVTLQPARFNPITLAAVFLACVLHFAAGRLAVFQMADQPQ